MYHNRIEQVMHTNEQLGKDLDASKKTISVYLEELSSLKRIKTQFEDVKKDYVILRNKYDNVQKEKEQTENSIREIRKECKNLENEIKSKNEKISILDKAISTYKLDLGKATDSIKNFINKKKQLENNIQELNNQREQYELSISNKEDRIKHLQQEKERLEGSLSEIARESKGLQASLNREIEKNEALTNTVNERVKECEELSKTNKELSKEISNLQDDNEDLKDDLDDANKKLTRKDQINRELNSQLDEQIQINRQLELDVDETKSQLSDSEKDCNLKQGALDFVKTVLSAKTIDDKSYVKLYENVNLIFNYIDDDVYRLVMSIKKLTPDEQELFNERLLHWAAGMKKRWLHNKTVIAFVGEFNAGKTSIVNRILSQDNPQIATLPVDVRDTTAIPTYISGGEHNLYSFFSPDNQLKYISENYFKSVDREMLNAIDGADSLIKYFVMSCKNQSLSKMSILDTPGFGSNNNLNHTRTIDVINECDALLWIIDVTTGEINKSSLKVIRNNFTRPLYIIINKIDLASKSQVEQVVNQVCQTLKREKIPFVRIVKYSDKAPLSTILEIIKEVAQTTVKKDYLVEFRYFLESVLEYQKSVMEENWKQYNECKTKEETLEYDFNCNMKELKEACEDAQNIPHWETYTFRKDRYEMSDGEYKKMSELLQDISTEKIPNLYEISDERQENKEQLQSAWIAYKTEQVKWNSLKSCMEKYENLCNNLKMN
jgi:tRNA U34 5-carboxymethylaminomethyl modifying GTPase MnmE/TrmE